MANEQADNRPWAKSSLIINSDVLSIDEIGRKVGQRTVGKNRWIADLEPGENVPLDDQLIAVEQFLAGRIELLEELAQTCEIYLHVGWAPTAGQDHVIVGQILIKLMSRINASVVLDTYTGCKFCQPDD